MKTQLNEMQSQEAKMLQQQIDRIDSNTGAACRDCSTIQELRDLLAYLLEWN